MPLIIHTRAICDSCQDEIEEETPLNPNRYPYWNILADKMSKAGWKMKLSEDKHEWILQCYTCKNK